MLTVTGNRIVTMSIYIYIYCAHTYGVCIYIYMRIDTYILWLDGGLVGIYMGCGANLDTKKNQPRVASWLHA